MSTPNISIKILEPVGVIGFSNHSLYEDGSIYSKGSLQGVISGKRNHHKQFKITKLNA